MKPAVNKVTPPPVLVRMCAGCRQTYDTLLPHCPNCGLIPASSIQPRDAQSRLELFALTHTGLLVCTLLALPIPPLVQTAAAVSIATFTSIALIRANKSQSTPYLQRLRNQKPLTKDMYGIYSYLVVSVMLIAALISLVFTVPLGAINVVLASVLTWTQTSHALSLTPDLRKTP